MTIAQAYMIIVGTALGIIGILCLIILLRREWKKRKIVRELQKTIDNVKNTRLHVDLRCVAEAMKQIDEVERRLNDLVKNGHSIKIPVELVGEEMIQKIEKQMKGRSGKKN